MFKRSLDLTKYGQSFFLFGPRQVGKTFLIKNSLSPDLYINLVDPEEFKRYNRNPSLLSKEINSLKKESCQVVIDEVQRLPDLLNEVQLIMDGRGMVQFILTGSSARKLRRAGVNLLGGRAIILHLHPLTLAETTDQFTLDEALRFGSIPNLVKEKDREGRVRLLKAYVEAYLKEEVQQEALVRNIPAFSRFLELAAHENGNILNFQNIARETGVSSKTIKEYFEILQDTLLGFHLLPFGKSSRRKIVSHPKFYFFDTGVVSALKGETASELIPGTAPYGRAFEHFIFLETRRWLDYRERETKLSFFRTSDGAEVDFILEQGEGLWAVEVKASAAPRLSDIRGLRSFMRDHQCRRYICVCLTPRAYSDGGVEFLPYQEYLEQI